MVVGGTQRETYLIEIDILHLLVARTDSPHQEDTPVDIWQVMVQCTRHSQRYRQDSLLCGQEVKCSPEGAVRKDHVMTMKLNDVLETRTIHDQCEQR